MHPFGERFTDAGKTIISSDDSKGDVSSDMDESTGSTGKSSNRTKVDTSLDIRQQLSRRDTNSVNRLRVLTIVVTALVAIGVSSLVFILTSGAETESFETNYEGIAGKILDSFYSIIDRAGSISSLGIAATIHGLEHSDSTWPFVTLSAFEQRSATTRKISGSYFVSIEPLVTNSDRNAWEQYVVRNESTKWIVDGLQYRNDTGVMFNYSLETAVEGMLAIQYIFYLNQDGESILDAGPGPYFPRWQCSPVLVEKPINENYLRKPLIADEFSHSAKNGVAVFGQMWTAPVGTIGDPNLNTNFFATVKSISYGYESPYLGDPIARLYIPIYDNFDPNKRKVVAILKSLIHWSDYFENILPVTATGIIVVLEDSCNGFFSFEMNGPAVTPIGTGDFHEPEYDEFKRSAKFDAAYSIHDGTNNGIPLDSSGCYYSLHVFPSKKYSQTIKSNKPVLITFAVTLCFLFVILTFMLYSHIVERRQQNILNKAVQTQTIVSSLFPKQVCERILEETDESGNKKKRGNSRMMFSRGETIQNFLLDGNDKSAGVPIADLFPCCTVFFADISGFTAWSSTRSPEQVFVLLQTLYQAYDQIATKRKVFKVETIGDCYVAVTGLPEPQKNHASIMARFAFDCQRRMRELTQELEVTLGPDCSDLKMRIGIHSGSVTAGVLRGDRARFQLFGDTVNTASRMESTGVPDKIQISSATADLLIQAGKSNWITPRDDVVNAKGKGSIRTFWLNQVIRRNSTVASNETSTSEGVGLSNQGILLNNFDLVRRSRLVDWMVELLVEHLKKIVAVRKIGNVNKPTNITFKSSPHLACCDEAKDVIPMSRFHPQQVLLGEVSSSVVIDSAVIKNMRDYVNIIATLYHAGNAFHNFEHACHVTLSVSKLLKRINDPEINDPNLQHDDIALAKRIHDSTYGISSDPMASFAMVFTGLIHDVDHRGCSNAQLIVEEPKLGEWYRKKSVAEQNSFDLAWGLLMEPQFDLFRSVLFVTQDELTRFRQFVVNAILATDIFDNELSERRKTRWCAAFAQDSREQPNDVEVSDRKATIVIEHVIQASDVSHTMQHWHIYLKWNKLLFKEMYTAYCSGRMKVDPSTFWYQGELTFFDEYVIPLAKKLKECHVFGVNSDVSLDYAVGNRTEWMEKGEAIVEEMMNEINSNNQNNNTNTDVEDNVVEDFVVVGTKVHI